MTPQKNDHGAHAAAAHHEAQQALPWLANGSLAGAELERVQMHLRGCAECRADLAQLHTLRATEPDPLPGLDVDAALARLLPQLDAAAPLQTTPLPVQRHWRSRVAANERSWLRAALVMQGAAIAVLAVLVWRPAAGPAADDAGNHAGNHADNYHVLGATPSAGAGAQRSLIVVFAPETPEREVRRIVRASGAHVSGGPTATGAWLLGTDQAPAAVAARLHAEPAVTLAEPLATQGQP